MSSPANPHTAGVIATWRSGVRPYESIGARYGLSKDAVCGIIRRAGLARQLAARGPLRGKRSTDWESRLHETWRPRAKA